MWQVGLHERILKLFGVSLTNFSSRNMDYGGHFFPWIHCLLSLCYKVFKCSLACIVSTSMKIAKAELVISHDLLLGINTEITSHSLFTPFDYLPLSIAKQN